MRRGNGSREETKKQTPQTQKQKANLLISIKPEPWPGSYQSNSTFKKRTFFNFVSYTKLRFNPFQVPRLWPETKQRIFLSYMPNIRETADSQDFAPRSGAATRRVCPPSGFSLDLPFTTESWINRISQAGSHFCDIYTKKRRNDSRIQVRRLQRRRKDLRAGKQNASEHDKVSDRKNLSHQSTLAASLIEVDTCKKIRSFLQVPPREMQTSWTTDSVTGFQSITMHHSINLHTRLVLKQRRI